MLFWTLAAALAALALAFFVVPFYRANGADEVAVDSVQRSENLRLFAERESELAQDLADGEIEADEHAVLLRELQQSLLDDVEESMPNRKVFPVLHVGLLHFSSASSGCRCGSISSPSAASHSATSTGRSRHAQITEFWRPCAVL